MGFANKHLCGFRLMLYMGAARCPSRIASRLPDDSPGGWRTWQSWQTATMQLGESWSPRLSLRSRPRSGNPLVPWP
jgi:hypothetical protein